MPKETINSAVRNTYSEPVPGNPDASFSHIIEEPFHLRVGWSREASYVQVASLAPDGVVLEPTPEGNGFFVLLNRDGVNRAIRALRKARDGAFGKDE